MCLKVNVKLVSSLDYKIFRMNHFVKTVWKLIAHFFNILGFI